jgi:hypothetical protein
MWFKKGELDEAAAEAAAKAKPDGEPALDKADEAPIDERYKDDGTLTHDDRARLSLRTGGTQMVPVVRASPPVPGDRMEEKDLVAEMHAGRTRMLLLVALAALLIGLLVAYFTVLR